MRDNWLVSGKASYELDESYLLAVYDSALLDLNEVVSDYRVGDKDLALLRARLNDIAAMMHFTDLSAAIEVKADFPELLAIIDSY